MAQVVTYEDRKELKIESTWLVGTVKDENAQLISDIFNSIAETDFFVVTQQVDVSPSSVFDTRRLNANSAKVSIGSEYYMLKASDGLDAYNTFEDTSLKHVKRLLNNESSLSRISSNFVTSWGDEFPLIISFTSTNNDFIDCIKKLKTFYVSVFYRKAGAPYQFPFILITLNKDVFNLSDLSFTDSVKKQIDPQYMYSNRIIPSFIQKRGSLEKKGLYGDILEYMEKSGCLIMCLASLMAKEALNSNQVTVVTDQLLMRYMTQLYGKTEFPLDSSELIDRYIPYTKDVNHVIEVQDADIHIGIDRVGIGTLRLTRADYNVHLSDKVKKTHFIVAMPNDAKSYKVVFDPLHTYEYGAIIPNGDNVSYRNVKVALKQVGIKASSNIQLTADDPDSAYAIAGANAVLEESGPTRRDVRNYKAGMRSTLQVDRVIGGYKRVGAGHYHHNYEYYEYIDPKKGRSTMQVGAWQEDLVSKSLRKNNVN